MIVKVCSCLTLIIAQTVLSSCAQGETLSVQGIVVHEATGDPVPRASIQIDLFVEGGLFKNGHVFTMGTYSFCADIQSDSSGEYNFAVEEGASLQIRMVNVACELTHIAKLLNDIDGSKVDVILSYPSDFKKPIGSVDEPEFSDNVPYISKATCHPPT
ncbi:MAG: hypothetical protein AAF141_15420 [Pseudomonadota bacterium]